MRPLIGISPDLSGGRYNLKEDYIRAFENTGFDPCIVPYLSDPAALVRRFDGFVFAGGDDIAPAYYGEELLFELTLIERARTDFEMVLFRECLIAGKPVLGICNGMQMMNVAMGGSLFQDLAKQKDGAGDHRSGHHEITTSGGCFGRGGKYMVNSSHHQSIKKEGRGVDVLARSGDEVIEAISIVGQRFSVGVQWHPEREAGNALNNELFGLFREACLAA